MTGIDVSADALEVARANAERAGLDVSFDLRDVQDGLDGSYDLVVSNPPYVSAGELAGLQPEVRDGEPRRALVDDGTSDAVAVAARDVLRPGGHLVLEIHEDRGAAMTELLAGLGYEDVHVRPDLAGRDRLVEGRWATSSSR